jgi:AcrR family transcriptional regulator
VETQRRDVVRNRQRILDAAAAAHARGEALALNAIARAADTGVATVYRHFASVEALEETLVWSRFDELRAMLQPSSAASIDAVLEKYFALLLSDPLFETVISRSECALDRTAELRNELIEELSGLMHREATGGRLRNDLDSSELLALLCGLAYSARTLGVSATDPRGRMLFEVLMSGLRASGA